MKNLTKQIEAILFYRNEPVSVKDFSKLLNVGIDQIQESIKELETFYKDRGITIVTDNDTLCFGTAPEHSSLIEEMKKEELSRDLGRAGLETLSIILYKGPISRREIDYIRGVNSGFIIRNLLIRGLIERVESETGERSYTYKPTLELLKHLGISKREELPDFERGFKNLNEFASTEGVDQEAKRGED